LHQVKPEELPPIPTAVIGSHALAAWYLTALEQIGSGAYGETEVREAVEDASALAIADQERAGIDVVSDGEVRRHDFIMSFYGRLQGLNEVAPRRRLGPYMYDSTAVYETASAVSAPDGLGTLVELEFARTRTSRPVKVALPGPLTLTNAIRVRNAYRDRAALASDLAGIVAAELRALVDAGCEVVQVDEPSFSAYWASASEGVALFNRCVEAVAGRATICLHVCFGNLRGRPQSPRSYREMLPALAEARADVLMLEFANREMAEAEVIARAGLPQVIGAGVVDVKSFYRERPEDVAGRLRRFLDAGLAPSRLWAVPDCGFWETPRWLAVAKLHALAAGARIVREEVAAPTHPLHSRGRSR
jgi:5-methyltetrahydropteroyltriglutamate--homocysteine methyltransferase